MADARQDERRARLLVTRILWGGLTLGVLVFFVVAVLISQGGGPPADPQLARLLFYVALGFTVVSIATGYTVRHVIYARDREHGPVSPAAYFTGNVVLFACAEAPGLFGSIVIIVGRSLYPAALIVVLALAVLAMNFPTGSVMQDEQFQDLTRT